MKAASVTDLDHSIDRSPSIAVAAFFMEHALSAAAEIRRTVDVFIDQALSPQARSAALARAARQGVAELVRSGRASPTYRVFVDGREGEPEERVKPDGWPGHMAVASQHPRLQYVFSDTPWIADWRSALMTLPSATTSPGVMGFGGTNSGAIILPWDVVDLFLGQREAA